MQTDSLTEKKIGIQRDRQINRQAGKQMYRQTDGQTDGVITGNMEGKTVEQITRKCGQV